MSFCHETATFATQTAQSGIRTPNRHATSLNVTQRHANSRNLTQRKKQQLRVGGDVSKSKQQFAEPVGRAC